jgi:PKHD-type hydroxylase
MRGEWCYFSSAFTPEQCDYIIEKGLELPVQDGTTGGNINHQHRRSKVRFIQKTDSTFTYLFDSLWKMALQANDEWFGFHIQKLNYIQLAEYSADDQGEYKKHHDVFWINNDPYYHRKLTCVVQLSDPSEYDGGDLELYELSLSPPIPEALRQRGTVIFFPSFIPHAALPVTRGLRRSLAVWFDGPKWR